MTRPSTPRYIRALLEPLRTTGHRPPMKQKGLDHLLGSKTVAKSWGEERWLVTEGAPFGFKLIYIKAGFRTSLQVHERKEEANLILRGIGRLYLGGATQDSIQEWSLSGGDIVHVRPGAVHRIEAVTDITLVEVSTPELDDVIRISDDWGRPNGRIKSEHVETGES